MKIINVLKKYYPNIDWRSRFSNKLFWISLVTGFLVLVQAVLAVFGVTFVPDVLGEQLTDVINSVFGVLTTIGIVMNPTTPGLSD